MSARFGFSKLPFDYYCPSVRDQLAKRICSTCCFYQTNLAAVGRHRKIHNEAHVEELEPSIYLEDEIPVETRNSGITELMPLTNIFDLLSSKPHLNAPL